MRDHLHLFIENVEKHVQRLAFASRASAQGAVAAAAAASLERSLIALRNDAARPSMKNVAALGEHVDKLVEALVPLLASTDDRVVSEAQSLAAVVRSFQRVARRRSRRHLSMVSASVKKDETSAA